MNVQPLAIQFPIVVYPSEYEPGRWTAHSLLTNTVALGDTVESSLDLLLELLEDIVEGYSLGQCELASPAPGDYWDKWQAAHPLDAELLNRVTSKANTRLALQPSPMLQVRQLDRPAA